MSAVKAERYAAYKDSGVEWLGEVPEHWEVKRIKELGSLVLGKMLDNTPEPGKVYKPYLKSKNIGWLKVTERNIEEMYFSPYEIALYRIKKDDLLFSEGGEVGKTSIWNNEISECYIQNSVHKFTANKNNNSRYLLYLSFSAGQAKYYDSIVNFVSIKHLTKEKLSRVAWLSPPLAEQTAIATYLDSKNAQIDRQIDLLSQKAMQYGKLKQSLINETVTRGLNKSVPMKDSGVEWIGAMPAHWEVKRAKDLFKKHDRACLENDEIVTAFRDGQVTLRLNRRVSGFTNAMKEHGYQRIHAGDLVIHAMDAFAGAVGVSDSTGKSSPVYSAYTAQNKRVTHLPYYGLLIREMALSGFISSLGKGIRERSTEFRHREFSPLKLIAPPITEQIAIATYLEDKSTQIDRIVTAINTQIANLKDLRKALINDVVTGKIKVLNEGLQNERTSSTR